jgi:hypothetical protein
VFVPLRDNSRHVYALRRKSDARTLAVAPPSRTLRDAVGLELFGIDCALDGDGEIVVFEVNASMLVHDRADFPYKTPHCRHIRAVYETTLARAAQRARQFQAA